MKRLAALLIFLGACGPKGLPKMPPPDYEESPDPWAEAGAGAGAAEAGAQPAPAPADGGHE